MKNLIEQIEDLLGIPTLAEVIEGIKKDARYNIGDHREGLRQYVIALPHAEKIQFIKDTRMNPQATKLYLSDEKIRAAMQKEHDQVKKLKAEAEERAKSGEWRNW